ncbi:MAG: helix-turn-helix transcriptional regulator [Cyclobacteriaceae bacterium]
MKGTNLGEFEELLMLVVARLYPEAYGLAIREEIKENAGRSVAMGAVHAALGRLEEKGFLQSDLASATHERGGRRKRLFAITASGKNSLEMNRSLRNNLWDGIPEIAWKNI